LHGPTSRPYGLAAKKWISWRRCRRQYQILMLDTRIPALRMYQV
jgi:hypothetical protein